ncbi:DDE-type integrase/transposase/recombinase [Azospirillum sp. B4]|uniref:DDE-type integrase/transposase/recombinase n=1 Tax=Azospirillum sp. B4 TaxID=95605 RepID=UPI00131F0B19|nr:DDE-type integrase/transposase/recombinase [Azospirillum sp. B4]
MTLTGSDQLWVGELTGDMTYVAVAAGLHFRGRDPGRLVPPRRGLCDQPLHRLTVAALKAAISAQSPTDGCVQHTDRGSQYASAAYRKILADNGLIGSMSRRGNPTTTPRPKAS